MSPLRLLSICVISLSTVHADPLSLKQHWAAGKVYTLQTVTETKMNQTLGAQMSVTQVTELRPQPKAQTGTAVQVKFLSTKANISGNGKTALYDSNDEIHSDPALVSSLGKAVGKSFSLLYDERDRFKGVSSLENMATEPASAPGLLALEESKRVATLFAKSIEMGLPPVPVDVGSTWTADEVLSLANIGDVHADITSKLESIERKAGNRIATISIDGKLSSTKSGVAKAEQSMELSPGSSIKGTLLFDIEQRVITQLDSSTLLQLKVNSQVFNFEMTESRRLSAATAN
jgi:hypothetical protein